MPKIKLHYESNISSLCFYLSLTLYLRTVGRKRKYSLRGTLFWENKCSVIKVDLSTKRKHEINFLKLLLIIASTKMIRDSRKRKQFVC